MFSIWRKESITIEDFSTKITVVEDKNSKPEVFVHENYAWLDILYLTFIFIATFCMLKIAFELPLLFSPEKAMRVEGVSTLPVENQKLFLLIGDEGLLNTHSLTVIVFFLMRLILHLFSNDKPETFQTKLDYMKKVWNQTLVIWGILFGLISTLGVLWQG